MTQDKNPTSSPARSPVAARSMRDTLLVIGFGVAALAFLVASGHPEWFSVRLASGTAKAMALAAASSGV